MPVSWWDTYGSYRPETWEYQITLAGPDQTSTMRVGAERVVHCRYATTPTEPWRGVSPLAHSRATSDLAAMLEVRLSQEVVSAVGTIIPIPANAGDTTEIQQQLAGLRGKLALVPTTAAGGTPTARVGRRGRTGAWSASGRTRHRCSTCSAPARRGTSSRPVASPSSSWSLPKVRGREKPSGASCTPPSPRSQRSYETNSWRSSTHRT